MKNISLKDFLKTYTAISNNFIDEYHIHFMNYVKMKNMVLMRN